eukprot:190861-Chlamydomonas_euryale.AAC.1
MPLSMPKPLLRRPCNDQELSLEGPLTGGAVLHDLVSELVAEGAVRGALRGAGSTWTPTAHSEAQSGAVLAFYQQNGWVEYETVKKCAACARGGGEGRG